NIFEVHDNIVDSIVASLSIYLDDAERSRMVNWGTQNALAYDNFLKGEYYKERSNHADWEKSMEYYGKAIARDPRFVNAYVGYAVAASNMAVYSRNDTVEELSRVVLDLERQLALQVPDSHSLNTL